MIDRELTKGVRPVDLIRIGRAFDGGYVVPRSVLSLCDAVVGLGVRDDWTFEKAASTHMHTCRCIHLYDPTTSLAWLCHKAIGVLPKLFVHSLLLDGRRLQNDVHRAIAPLRYMLLRRQGGTHFKEWAGGEGGVKASETIRRAQAAGGSSVLLKVDIEGAEYGFFGDVNAWADKVPLVVVEFHGLGEDAGAFNSVLRDLTKCYTPVHIHGNSFAGQLACGFPCVPEITFVRSDLIDPNKSRRSLHYPVAGVDQPSHRDQLELAFEA